MKQETSGWVVMTDSHPINKKPAVMWFTFSPLRKDSVNEMCGGYNKVWKEWKRKYGYKLVKAKLTIEV